MNWTVAEYVMLGSAVAAFTTLFVAGYFRQQTVAEKEAYVMNWGNLAKQILPIALSLIPGLPPIVANKIVGSVLAVESLPGKTGAEKKAIVMNEVVTELQNVNVIKGKDVVDVVAVSEAVDAGIDAGISAVNAISKTKALNQSPEPKATGGSDVSA